MNCDIEQELSPLTAPPTASPPPQGRFPYGWRAEPVMEQVVIDDVPQFDIHEKPLMAKVEGKFVKRFSHPFRTVIVGAPKRGPLFANVVPVTKRQTKRHSESKPTKYIVFSDRSLRRLDKVLLKAIGEMTPEQQVALVAANAKGATGP